MFDFVGRHKRLLQFFLILIIVPSFALFGLQSYDRVFSSGNAVAEVAGLEVTQQEIERALDQQREQFAQALGRQFDPSLLDTPEARREILDSLIAQRALLAYAERNGMGVTAEQLHDAIVTLPVFQENGQFSRARYQALLRNQNLSEAQFEAQLRRDMVLQLVAGSLLDSTVASKTVAQRVAQARAETREVSEILLPAAQFAPQVKLASDAVETYYKANAASFEAPEMVRAEYVVLSPQALAAQETVDPAAVAKWYEENIQPKLRERADARRKADGILEQVRKEPAKFAEVARASSQDSASATQGGDLGWFGRGAMVKPFEDAVFRLKENETSGIVETEFGFHVIRVTGIRKPGQDGAKTEERRASHILIGAPKAEKDLAAVRPEIERELRQQAIAKRFPELADSFTNIAYEQPDSLAPLADKFQLKIQQSGWITRGAARPPLDNPRLLASLFGADAVKNGRNTEAVETSPGTLVVARVLEHKPATVRPLDEVRAEIVKRLTDAEALKLAHAAGAAKLAEAKAGKVATGWGQAREVSREKTAGVEQRAVAPIFRTSAAELPAYVGVELPAGYGIYRISKATQAGSLEPARVEAASVALARQDARESYEAFMAGLKARSNVKIYESRLEKK